MFIKDSIRIAFVLVILATIITGCGILNPATQEVMSLDRAQIGSGLSVWVTYDVNKWEAVKWIDGTNQAGEPIKALNHKTLSGCSLRENLGRGTPDKWTFGSADLEIGGVLLRVEQWTDATTKLPALLVYQLPAGEQTTPPIRIEVEPGPDYMECIVAAEAVISQSVADINITKEE